MCDTSQVVSHNLQFCDHIYVMIFLTIIIDSSLWVSLFLWCHIKQNSFLYWCHKILPTGVTFMGPLYFTSTIKVFKPGSFSLNLRNDFLISSAFRFFGFLLWSNPWGEGIV